MNSRESLAVQEVRCRRCGEPTDDPVAEVRRGDASCGPCRAELLGKVYLVVPTDAVPGPLLGDGRRDRLPAKPTGGRAIHRELLAWAHALGALLGQLRSLDRSLMETTPEEAVADAVMGAELLAGATLRPLLSDHRGRRALALEGLPPDVARRLVRDTFATPPSCGEEDGA